MAVNEGEGVRSAVGLRGVSWARRRVSGGYGCSAGGWDEVEAEGVGTEDGSAGEESRALMERSARVRAGGAEEGRWVCDCDGDCGSGAGTSGGAWLTARFARVRSAATWRARRSLLTRIRSGIAGGREVTQAGRIDW